MSTISKSGPLPLIIDCDPGIDDAVMLMMAFLSPRVDVRAVTTVAGNVPLRLTSRNARMICERMGRGNVPVYAGCPRPMTQKNVMINLLFSLRFSDICSKMLSKIQLFIIETDLKSVPLFS
jgi:inosine-uridine nucleoside N-ribohydrolase